MHDLHGLSIIKQSTNAGLPVFIAYFEFTAELITGGIGMVAVIKAYDFNHSGDHPVNLTPVCLAYTDYMPILEQTS